MPARAYDPSGPLEQSAAGVAKTYEQNLHWDLALVTSLLGSITGTIAYNPWGKTRVATGDGRGVNEPVAFSVAKDRPDWLEF